MTSEEYSRAVLVGASSAAQLLEDIGVRESLSEGRAPVDVFQIISGLEIPIICKPLGGLLGVFLPAPMNGIIVTTNRDFHVQRFTAAHELGHAHLEHRVSLDTENCIGFVARGGQHSDPQEVAADAFASELLVPRWLVAAIVERLQWTQTELRSPSVIYQLSLRLGISYRATCWSLFGHRVLRRDEAFQLAGIQPKVSKQNALRGLELEDSWADVWKLNECDESGLVLGSPNDVILLELTEHAASGSTWGLVSGATNGLEIVEDERLVGDVETIGGPNTRSMVLRGKGDGVLRLDERRRWESGVPPTGRFEIRYSLVGKEVDMPRVVRRAMH